MRPCSMGRRSLRHVRCIRATASGSAAKPEAPSSCPSRSVAFEVSETSLPSSSKPEQVDEAGDLEVNSGGPEDQGRLPDIPASDADPGLAVAEPPAVSDAPALVDPAE